MIYLSSISLRFVLDFFPKKKWTEISESNIVTTLLPSYSSEPAVIIPAQGTTSLFVRSAAAPDPASPPGRSAAGSDLAQEATRGRKEETFPRVGWL